MPPTIRLRQVRVHNLQSVDLNLPKKQLLAFCGPSGSGKSSLAVDTLFAEGQRRYLDTFSIASRGLIEQPEKPDADEIESVPPAIAITRSTDSVSARVTVGMVSELDYFLQVAVAQYGRLVCPDCELELAPADPDSIAQRLLGLEVAGDPPAQVMIGFEKPFEESATIELETLLAAGFQRAIYRDEVRRLTELQAEKIEPSESGLLVLLDRVRLVADSRSRLLESLEAAMELGQGRCVALVSGGHPDAALPVISIQGKPWTLHRFSSQPACPSCGREYRRLAVNELSFHSPAAACEECDGLGRTPSFSEERLAIDPRRSLADGACAAIQVRGLKSFREALETELGEDFERPIDSWPAKTADQCVVSCIEILERLYRDEATPAVRKKLDRFRVDQPCPACLGKRLNAVGRSHRLGDFDLGQLTQFPVEQLEERLGAGRTAEGIPRDGYLFAEMVSRLQYLQRVGLGYLSLAREIQTLSTGERQRVAMTNALGSQLVNMLYIFDEPCAGLHPADLPDLIAALRTLVDQGNTVLAVDHELDLIREVDHVTEFGPGSGSFGGRILYAGPPAGLAEQPDSPTGEFLSGRRTLGPPDRPSGTRHASLRLTEARGHNLRNIDVEFPLGQLCVVTGVSGSGKSTLVVDTLYPAIQNRLSDDFLPGLPFKTIHGVEHLDQVILVDQSPLGATSRSNPATYCKAFDAIRQVFADTVDARARNFGIGKFSFNTAGGRCEACQGEGTRQIDMKFMANLRVTCKFCQGQRYKQEILNCRYRSRNIAQVLEMTVREAFAFFRGQKKVQSRLKPLIDVGLDYLRLGQPASTLSSGEAQRLRLAGFLGASRQARTLFVLDEPTIGLHYADVEKLLNCLGALLAEGHSVILVEHNRMVMNAADYLVDLGPGAGDRGGQVVAYGSPAEVARCSESKTGRVLAQLQQ